VYPCLLCIIPIVPDRRHKRSNAPSITRPVVDKEETWPLVKVSAFCSLLCFDTDGSVAGRTFGP